MVCVAIRHEFVTLVTLRSLQKSSRDIANLFRQDCLDNSGRSLLRERSIGAPVSDLDLES